jgi:hypothetical protein
MIQLYRQLLYIRGKSLDHKSQPTIAIAARPSYWEMAAKLNHNNNHGYTITKAIVKLSNANINSAKWPAWRVCTVQCK